MLQLIQNLDSAVLLLIQEHLRCGLLTPVMVFFSTLGNAGIAWIVLSLVLAVLPKTRKCGVLMLASLLVCYLFNNILLKNLVARPRPYTRIEALTMLMRCPSDWSFPSGHACSSFAAAGAFFRVNREKGKVLRVLPLGIAAVIAFSRLYVGVHYPTDVLVGTLIGVVGSGLVCRFGSCVYDRAAAGLRRR